MAKIELQDRHMSCTEGQTTIASLLSPNCSARFQGIAAHVISQANTTNTHSDAPRCVLCAIWVSHPYTPTQMSIIAQEDLEMSRGRVPR